MSSAVRHFVRHYVEMVIAMFLGMAVLGAPAVWAIAQAGASWPDVKADAPALALLGMAVTMTVPMVAWMRHRGHGWRPSAEMSASMFVPTFVAIGLLWAGLTEDVDAVIMLEHVAMLASMLLAMLLRPAEYTGAHHGHGHAEQVAT